jgi:sortase family protein
LVVHQQSRADGAPAGPDIGVVSPGRTAASTVGGSAGPAAGGEPTVSGGPLPTHSTELGAQGSDAAAPSSVTIPRLNVRAVTTAAGVGADHRSLDLLPSARAVVWWAYGAEPGAATGTVLLAGHVSWDGRLGVLSGLRSLRLGDRITLRRHDGRLVTYAVTGRRRVPKRSLDELGLFATGGAPRLVLVTCGGAYDAGRHSYEDNVVVQARPV